MANWFIIIHSTKTIRKYSPHFCQSRWKTQTKKARELLKPKGCLSQLIERNSDWHRHLQIFFESEKDKWTLSIFNHSTNLKHLFLEIQNSKVCYKFKNKTLLDNGHSIKKMSLIIFCKLHVLNSYMVFKRTHVYFY